jgi:hypothetical protein
MAVLKNNTSCPKTTENVKTKERNPSCRRCSFGGLKDGTAIESFFLSFVYIIPYRVSFETSYDAKQPKLEPKLVSALSERKRLFRLIPFCTKTESFD